MTASDAGGTYSGSPYAVTGVAKGVGGISVGGSFTFTYYAGSGISGNGSTTAPTNAGTYTVVAAFSSTDSNYANASSTPTVFVIGQATPKVTTTDAGGPANGNPYPATGTATGVGGIAVAGSFGFTYYVGNTVNGVGSSTAPASPGTYTVVAAFTSSDPNYTNSPSAPLVFVITAVAAPGVSAPSSVSTNENVALVFSASNGDAITLTDSAASANSDSLTLAVTHGTLMLGSTTGLTLSSGKNNSASMTVKGTLANLNAARNGLKFTPTSGFSGQAAIAITLRNATTGESAAANVAIAVIPTVSCPRRRAFPRIPR